MSIMIMSMICSQLVNILKTTEESLNFFLMLFHGTFPVSYVVVQFNMMNKQKEY